MVVVREALADLMEIWQHRRQQGRARRAIIEAAPALKARERLKQSAYEGVVQEGLAVRGVPVDEAALLARVGLACFHEATARWLSDDDPDGAGLSSHNRAASAQTWGRGEVLSIDSGGNLGGYIGDICRMGVLGAPDAELNDLLAEVEAVQQAAFARVRAGCQGGDLIAAGQAELALQPHHAVTDFFAHGMGVIAHEAPFLMTNHPVAYDGIDADQPLEAGMMLSVETTMLHPTRGFIKLEDTLAVTDTGYDLFGSTGRGWNLGGVAT